MKRQEYLGIQLPAPKNNLKNLTMKGNIGPTKKLNLDAGTTSQ